MKQTEKIVPEDWITHLGGANREPMGWIAPRGEGFVAIDLLGRERSGTVDWLEAEETLDELGIRYLATPYELVTDSGTSKVPRLLMPLLRAVMVLRTSRQQTRSPCHTAAR